MSSQSTILKSFPKEFAPRPLQEKLIKEIQEVQITKSPLKSLFSQYIDEAIHPKVGFSGYPNETVTYLGSLRDWRVFEQLPLLRSLWGKDRATNWKIINIEWFLRVWE